MPSRVIRDGWIESERIDSLDPSEERFFLRLCLRADDFGRYHGNHALLRSNLFPLKPDVRITDIPRWLAACEKAGLLRCYVVQGKAFVEILRFDQRMRAKVSKFPAPPDGSGQTPDTCQTHDSTRPPESEAESEAESNTESEANLEARSPNRTSCSAVAEPTKKKPAATDDEWLAELSADPAYLGINVKLEHAKAARWCEANRKQLSRKRFINWLNRCDRPLNAPSNVQQRTWQPKVGDY